MLIRQVFLAILEALFFSCFFFQQIQCFVFVSVHFFLRKRLHYALLSTLLMLCIMTHHVFIQFERFFKEKNKNKTKTSNISF